MLPTARPAPGRALRAALAATVLASPAVAAAQVRVDPFATRDAAKTAQAGSLVGAAHLQWAQRQLADWGLDPMTTTLAVVNATTDSRGGTHARLRQYHRGVPVRGGRLVTHADASGAFLPPTDHLVRNLTLSTTPRLSSTDAVTIASQQPSHLGSYAIAPRVELVVLARRSAVLATTGAPPPATYTSHVDPDAIPDPVNATQLVRRVASTQLAYRVRTIEGDERASTGANAWTYLIDASTGAVVRATPSARSITGHGKGKFSGAVAFSTIAYNAGFRLEDAFRQFHTVDSDTSDGDPVNNDGDNQWGDGAAFAGDDFASDANRQTALVDGHFGATVYWDLMDRVYGRQGPDDDFYSVNIIAHYKTNWNDAEYSYTSGNIHLGDGGSRQALDCLGHEQGHGLNDFTVDFDGGDEPDGLNESNSDIWGAMTTYYLGGGGFAAAAHTIPNTGGSFIQVCSGRNMRKPTNAGSGSRGPDAWYPGIGDNDEHYVAQPNNRAFFFLAQGASAFMKDDSYSPLLPWGMTGIGNDKAARLWYDALTGIMDDDDGYAEARSNVVTEAIWAFGPFSTEELAVENAYAGINVGGRGFGYPAAPPSASEHEPNDSFLSANALTKPSTAVPAGAPKKLHVTGTGATDDWFSVSLLPGQSITARVTPIALADYDLEIYDGFNALVSRSIKGVGAADLLTWTAPGGFGGNLPQTFYLRVKPFTASATTAYFLDLDWF